jgi:hypothetical protein
MRTQNIELSKARYKLRSRTKTKKKKIVEEKFPDERRAMSNVQLMAPNSVLEDTRRAIRATKEFV